MSSSASRLSNSTNSPSACAFDVGLTARGAVDHEHGQTYESNFTRVDALLPKINITKQCLRKLQAVHLVREQRGQRSQELAFNARPFVLCGLPLRRPAAGQLIHRRQNGKFFLEVVAHPRFGLPYGQDRLIPIWLATLALQQKNRTVHFETPAHLLDYFRRRKDGSQYRRMKSAFQRVFAATMFFGTDEQRMSAKFSTAVGLIFSIACNSGSIADISSNL